MTPSPEEYQKLGSDDEILPIVEKLFPDDTAKSIMLNHILNRFGVTNHFTKTAVLLKRLKNLLEIGKSYGIPNDWNHFREFDLPEKWDSWLDNVSEAVQIYVEIDGKGNFSSIPGKTGSNRFDCIQEEHTDEDANLTGLQLIFVSLLLLDDSRYETIGIDTISDNFKKARKFNTVLCRLQLDMGIDPTMALQLTINQCKELIAQDVFDSSYVTFMRQVIKASEMLLTGKYLHNRKGTKKSSISQSSSSSEQKFTNRPKARRYPKFYDQPQDNSVDQVGEFVEQVTVPGEESIHGVVEMPSEDRETLNIPKEIADAELKARSKYWLRNYAEALPWNNFGINPITRKILVRWIKENDTAESLMFSLMLSTGLKIHELMELIIGVNSDITRDGNYRRYYSPPDNYYKPTAKQEPLMVPTSNSFEISFNSITTKLLKKHIPIDIDQMPLSKALSISADKMEENVSRVIKLLIDKGAKGLARDRIHVVFKKKISEISNDEFIGYLLAGSEKEAPPVSSYYSRISQKTLQSIYNQAINELFTI